MRRGGHRGGDGTRNLLLWRLRSLPRRYRGQGAGPSPAGKEWRERPITGLVLIFEVLDWTVRVQGGRTHAVEVRCEGLGWTLSHSTLLTCRPPIP